MLSPPLHASSTPQDMAGDAQSVWKDRDGNPVPNTDTRASRKGFGGALVLTSDLDWKQKWETPEGTTPRFNVAEKIPYGQKIALLTFFANPALDTAGMANISCSIRVINPEGKVVTSQDNLTCYQGKIAGSLLNTYLAAPVIDFVGEQGDPSGKWTFEVKLKDTVRNVEVPLKTSLILQK